MAREVILDIETTGLYTDEGERLVSIGMVEMIDGTETGITMEFIVNPGRESSPGAFAVHKMTLEYLSQFPGFAVYAQQVRDFIGNDPVIITCRAGLHNGKPYTLDKDFVENELKLAGVAPIQEGQWVNARLIAEEMFGYAGAKLDSLLDRYKINREERTEKGHGALMDAKLLAKIYARLKTDYANFKKSGASAANDMAREIPVEWKRVLQGVQDIGAEEAVIVGGALRDLFNKRAIKDVDIFLKSRGGTEANKRLLREAFSAAMVDLKEGALENAPEKISPPPEAPADSMVQLRIESWTLEAKNSGTVFNFIFVENNIPGGKDEFTQRMIDRSDLGLCKIAYNGVNAGGEETLIVSDDYKKDAQNKTITLLRQENTSKDHLQRIVKKYPDWTPCPKAKKILLGS